MSKQTQGPWVIDWDTFPDGYVWIETQTGGGVALVDEARRADLNLIAAAPDLLEALEFMLSVFNENYPDVLDDAEDREAWAKARAAIKKAMGE